MAVFSPAPRSGARPRSRRRLRSQSSGSAAAPAKEEDRQQNAQPFSLKLLYVTLVPSLSWQMMIIFHQNEQR